LPGLSSPAFVAEVIKQPAGAKIQKMFQVSGYLVSVQPGN